MTTPEHITELKPNEIFVFGSNRAGRHGRGAAKDALKFGAKHGVGEGICGKTYGIATKDRDLNVLSLREIEINVARFIRTAKAWPGLTFLVTPIGCGLAGYSPKDIAPMFVGAPANVVLPASFQRALAEGGAR
jgi:hypothetical protein